MYTIQRHFNKCQAIKLKICQNVNDSSTNTTKKEELKSAERERHTMTSPKTFWSRWYTLLRMHATLTLKWERSVICSRRFFEAFSDLFGACFLCLKDYFCVSCIVLSHAKIHNSDGRVGEEKIDWLEIKKIYRSFRR